MTKTRNIILWIISVILMLFVVVYQKTTGPTYPHKGEIDIYDAHFDYSMPRSNDGAFTVPVYVIDKSHEFSGTYKFRRFRSHDEWMEQELTRNGDTLGFTIPNQPSAGKVMYQLFISKGGQPKLSVTDNPIILRFRDHVPMWVIVFHLIFIFGAITLSIRTGFEAMFHGNNTKILTILTIIFLIFGGFVFGPIMQKYAFGEFWTGWPFGHDLTDNKTAVALIFWGIALWASVKKPQVAKWHIIASVVLLIVYLIPHSLLGSEIDYTKVENQQIEKTTDK